MLQEFNRPTGQGRLSMKEADAMSTRARVLVTWRNRSRLASKHSHRWRNQYGGMKAEEAKRLKELEENKLVADLTLDKDILKEALMKGIY